MAENEINDTQSRLSRDLYESDPLNRNLPFQRVFFAFPLASPVKTVYTDL